MFIKSSSMDESRNQMYTLDIQASALQSGVYQVRMSCRTSAS